MIYSYINTSGIGKTRNCMETRRPKGGVFSYNFEFSQLPRMSKARRSKDKKNFGVYKRRKISRVDIEFYKITF